MSKVGATYDFRLFDADLDPQAKITFAAMLRAVRPYQPQRDVWVVSLSPVLQSTEYHDSREPFEYAALMARHANANIDVADHDWTHVYVLRALASDIVDQKYTTARTTPEWWALIKARAPEVIQ